MDTMTEKKKNEILPTQKTKEDNDPEKRMVRSILSTAVREATSASTTPKAAQARKEAIRWIRRGSTGPFSFGNVVEYVFEDVDPDRLRGRLDDMIEGGESIQLDDEEDT